MEFKNRNQDFIYNTIESEDNPLITFKNIKMVGRLILLGNDFNVIWYLQ